MLPLEKQVCSLDLSIKLKKLGLVQESYFYWSEKHLAGSAEFEIVHSARGWQATFSAFTVAELGEILPEKCQEIDRIDMNLRVEKIDNEYKITYEANYYNILDTEEEISDINEANARAKMLIYLIENNLVDNAWKKNG